MPYIYSISHPITKEIVYVGKTIDKPIKRLMNHINSNKKRPITLWIKDLMDRDLIPIVDTLDVVGIEEANEAEAYWISQIKAWGFSLLNINGNKVLKTHLSYKRPKRPTREKLVRTRIGPDGLLRAIYKAVFCPTCNIEFIIREKSDQIYCSINCVPRKSAGVYPMVPCKHCGNLYHKTPGAGKMFCSKKCVGAFYKGNFPKERKDAISKSKYKKITAFNSTESLSFNSINECSAHLKCSPSSISNVLNGRESHVKGWKFKFN